MLLLDAHGDRVPGVTFWLDDACDDLNPERRANARLVAAAPELLAALRDILSGQLTGAVDTNAERFQRARAAVAAAEGRDA